MSDDGSPLFVHEPRSEQEVVCLFAAALSFIEPSLIIDTVRMAFPDCLARDRHTDEIQRIEFELYASSFLTHGHDHQNCHVLVCWIDDHRRWPDKLRVVELAREIPDRCPWLIRDLDDRDPKAPWDRRSFLERARREGTSPENLARIVQVIDCAELNKLGPQWLVNSKAVFAVGDREQFFKINSTGHIGFPFCRLDTGERFGKLIVDLNATLERPLFTPADRGGKNKGGTLADLWPDTGKFTSFLDVWNRFAKARMSA